MTDTQQHVVQQLLPALQAYKPEIIVWTAIAMEWATKLQGSVSTAAMKVPSRCHNRAIAGMMCV